MGDHLPELVAGKGTSSAPLGHLPQWRRDKL